MDNLSTRVKKRREDLGLSQADVAKRAAISQSTVAQIESGRNKGSKYVVQLAAALNVSIVWLAEGRGERGDLPTASFSKGMDTGPLRYDAERAALLTLQQRTIIEQAILSLLDLMDEKPKSGTKKLYISSSETITPKTKVQNN